MAGLSNSPPGVPTILGVNTAVNFKAGVPGSVGAALDTLLYGFVILKNAGPATLTINSGFRAHDNTQDTTHYVFTGSTTLDVTYSFSPALINTAGALQVTASVANMVIVFTQAAQGGIVG